MRKITSATSEKVAGGSTALPLPRRPTLRLPFRRSNRETDARRRLTHLCGRRSRWLLGAKYPQYKKLAEVRNPSPAEAIVFVDESILTLDDGYFAVNVDLTQWQNSPTVRHGQSAVFAFADGHAERWSWRALKVEQDLSVSVTLYGANTTVDLQRLARAVFRP